MSEDRFPCVCLSVCLSAIQERKQIDLIKQQLPVLSRYCSPCKHAVDPSILLYILLLLDVMCTYRCTANSQLITWLAGWLGERTTWCTYLLSWMDPSSSSHLIFSFISIDLRENIKEGEEEKPLSQLARARIDKLEGIRAKFFYPKKVTKLFQFSLGEKP